MIKLNRFSFRKIWKICLCVGILFLILDIHAQETICTNSRGESDNYSYELWKQEPVDEGCMTLKPECQFSCEWTESSVNFLARRGLKFDETQTPNELGFFTASYTCNYKPVGNSYLGVYGWTVEPLVEFYIIESWGTWRPPGGTPKGAITIDGGTYDIYQTTRTNQPSIKGTATFQQYWSVRRTKRTSGTVSISQHFAEWAKKSMNLGFLYDMNLLIEGYKSSGTADFTEASLTIGQNNTYLKTDFKENKITIQSSNVSDILNISIFDNQTSIYNTEIFDIRGVKVKTLKLKKGLNNINIVEFQNGVYFISTAFPNEVITKKFVK